MKHLQEENSPVKEFTAELSLDIGQCYGMCSGIVVKPSRRRPLVDHLHSQYRASERHASQILRLGL
jgi:sulfite exporter TauE/SafE